VIDLALCGAGRITMAHALAAASVPDVRFVRVASRDPARAAERAQQLGARPCRYVDLPDGADVVLVATPPPNHAADARRAVLGGAHVLVEKPLVTTLVDADSLVTVDDEAGGGRIAYGENLVHSPVVAAAAHRAGAIGTLTYIECRSLQPRPDWGSFLDPASGGGVLFDLGVHPLAVALLLAGPAATPIAVRAHLDASRDLAVDDVAQLWLRFDTGVAAHVVASWRHRSTIWDLQASSETGVVRAELEPVPTLEVDGEPVALPPPRAGVEPAQLDTFGFVGQLDDIVSARRTARPPASGVAFGRHVLDIVCGAYASAGRDGQEVELPYGGPRDRTPHQLWRGGSPNR
jgi:predicted dehydrogenase